jgi:antirestriction protein ArdC
MSTDKARSIADDALRRLTAELEAGRSETLTQYLAAMGRFHRYSWNNAMLIHSQWPTATRVAGYHTWQQLGRSVRRGEQGIVIVAPMATHRREPAAKDETHEVPAENGTKPPNSRHAGFRTAYVFDVEQTEGRPLPAFARTEGDPKDFGDKLKAIVAARGIRLEYDSAIAPADGVSSGGVITLRPGLSPAEEFSVLAHELGHEMLHRGPDRAALPKVIRETQAEAVAYVITRGVGLDTRTAAADYIALYNGNAKTLAESLAAIQEASSAILNELLAEDRVTAAQTRSASLEQTDTAPEHMHEDGMSAGQRPPQSTSGPDPLDSASIDR